MRRSAAPLAVRLRLPTPGRRRLARAAAQGLAVAASGACLALVVIPAVGIVAYLAAKGLPAIGWTFVTEAPRMGMKEGGIMPAIIGTVYLMAGTAALSLPVGVLAGVFLSEYAPGGPLTRLARLSIANMAGVPSVVYGLFGLAAFVLLLGLGSSLASASLTLGAMTLPVVITATEEALRQVPESFRQASLALGASRWRTTWRVVLPAAMPGIITGAVLGVGRAAGETAPILLTGAAFSLPEVPRSVLSQFMALPYHLYVIATQVPNVPERAQWGTAAVLVLLVVGVNAAAAAARARLRRRRAW